MILWRHYTEAIETRTELEWGIYEHHRSTKHTLAFKFFRRYLILTWVWTG